MASGIPLIISHTILARMDIVPPPYSTSFPNGKNAKPANLKHCKPIGIPIYNVPITVDTRISVVPVLRTPTQDVPLLLITVPM